MLRLFERETVEWSWLNGELRNHKRFLITVDSTKIPSFKKIREWADSHSNDVYACVHADIEIPDPQPPTPMPTTAEVEAWQAKLQQHKDKQPVVDKKWWGGVIPSLTQALEADKWRLELIDIEDKDPLIQWKSMCGILSKRTKTVDQWTFVFETEKDKTWFTMNYVTNE